MTDARAHEETILRLAFASQNVKDAALDYAHAIAAATDRIDVQTIADAISDDLDALMHQQEAVIRKREQLRREAAERR